MTLHEHSSTRAGCSAPAARTGGRDCGAAARPLADLMQAAFGWMTAAGGYADLNRKV